jgi:hypothetical protein
VAEFAADTERLRKASTVVGLGVKLTSLARESESVFTAQRPTPQWTGIDAAGAALPTVETADVEAVATSAA